MTSNISEETLRQVHRPFDIVEHAKNHSIGLVCETILRESETSVKYQSQYSVHWIVGSETTHAWFNQEELINHGSIALHLALSAQNCSSSTTIRQLFER